MSLPTDNLPKVSLWVSQRRRLAGLGAVIILVAGWWLVWRPSWRASSALPSEVSFQEPKIRIENDIAAVREINNRFAAVSSDKIERLKIVLPVGQDLPNLIAQLEGIAKINQFDLLTVDFVTSSESGTFSNSQNSDVVHLLNINLTLGPGSYEQFKSFLSGVASSLRLLTVTGVNFNFASLGRSGYIVNLASPYLSKD